MSLYKTLSHNHKVNYDYSVRNASGNIIQFLYGEDGMDYIKIVNQHSSLLTDNFETIVNNNKFSVDEDYSSYLTEATIENMKSEPNYQEQLDSYFNKLVDKYQSEIIGTINFQNLFNRNKSFYIKGNFDNLTSSYDKLSEILPNILGNNLPSNKHFDNLQKAKERGFKIT